jgi:hypothetical protein
LLVVVLEDLLEVTVVHLVEVVELVVIENHQELLQVVIQQVR